jgi:hypothetical protein
VIAVNDLLKLAIEGRRGLLRREQISRSTSPSAKRKTHAH